MAFQIEPEFKSRPICPSYIIHFPIYYNLQLFLQNISHELCTFICKVSALVTIVIDDLTQVSISRILILFKIELFFALSPSHPLRRDDLRIQGFKL